MRTTTYQPGDTIRYIGPNAHNGMEGEVIEPAPEIYGANMWHVKLRVRKWKFIYKIAAAENLEPWPKPGKTAEK